MTSEKKPVKQKVEKSSVNSDFDPTASNLSPASTAMKRKGPPKNKDYLPWEEAREFARSEMLPSRAKYKEWHAHNKIKCVPPYPYRVYKEWTSWNDFLGNNTKFNSKIGTVWRSYYLAIQFIHSLKLKNYEDWIQWCRDGNRPEDIPARPEYVYKEWKSWNHWLGNKPIEAIETQQSAKLQQVYYIIQMPDVPSNVITFGVEPAGIDGLKRRWERDKFNVVKMFWYDPEKAQKIKEIVEALSTPYLGETNQRIAQNVWEIVWHMQLTLQQVKI